MSLSSTNSELIEIYSGDLWEAELLKTILSDHGIPCFLKNNVLASFAYKPSYSQGVKVMIRRVDGLRAQEIVDEFRKK